MKKFFKGKKVLVTGGAGFIGSHIVQGLLERGAQVTVLDDLSSGTLDNLAVCRDKIKFIKGDIREDKDLDAALFGVDCVSHQAALRSVPKSVEMPYKYHDVNVTGTLRLFLKAREKNVKRICFASSSSVYGDREKFPERESDLPKPVSPYAASKLMAEHYAYIFSKLYGMEIVSLRYFNVFGPRQSLENKYAVVIPKFIVSLLKGQRPPIYGDGKQERDFTYIENVVEANLCALAAPDVAGEVFNVAGGDPKSVNHLFDSIKSLVGSKLAPVYEPVRTGDVKKTHADISKAKKLLRWKTKVGFQEGLKRTVGWFKTNHKEKA